MTIRLISSLRVLYRSPFCAIQAFYNLKAGGIRDEQTTWDNHFRHVCSGTATSSCNCYSYCSSFRICFWDPRISSIGWFSTLFRHLSDTKSKSTRAVYSMVEATSHIYCIRLWMYSCNAVNQTAYLWSSHITSLSPAFYLSRHLRRRLDVSTICTEKRPT